jgi:hypothetical protein
VKNALEILEIYSLRAKLHRQVYQHRIANVAEAMITDVFIAANEHFRVKAGAAGGEGLSLAEAARDPRAFVRLTDSILDALDMSPSSGLERAAHLLGRLKRRDFYKQVGMQVNIETLPRCANPKCNKGTPIDAKFCPNCGESTASRKARFTARAACTSDGVLITEAQVRNELLELCRDDVRRPCLPPPPPLSPTNHVAARRKQW